MKIPDLQSYGPSKNALKKNALVMLLICKFLCLCVCAWKGMVIIIIISSSIVIIIIIVVVVVIITIFIIIIIIVIIA